MKALNLLVLGVLILFGGLSEAKELRKRIVVVDTGISKEMVNLPFMCKDSPVLAVKTGASGFDAHGHGSYIVGLIGARIDVTKYCITSIRFHFFEDPDRLYATIWAFRMASKLKSVAALHFSGGGVTESEKEIKALEVLLKKGVKLILSAGNEGEDLTKQCNYWPACLKFKQSLKQYQDQVRMVVALDIYMNRLPSSNWSRKKGIDSCIGEGSNGHVGTSVAAAIKTGELFSGKPSKECL